MYQSWTPEAQVLLEQITESVVEEFYELFERPAVVASLYIDLAEVDRAIALCLSSA